MRGLGHRPDVHVPGRTWTAPARASTGSTAFSESITAAGEAGGRRQPRRRHHGPFGVLYDPDTHDIWVDVDQDRDFTDDEMMRPYKEKFDVGHFGADNPATAVAERCRSWSSTARTST